MQKDLGIIAHDPTGRQAYPLRGPFCFGTFGPDGRATVYKTEGRREYLRFTGLMGPRAADLLVALVRSQEDRLDPGVELGLLTAFRQQRQPQEPIAQRY